MTATETADGGGQRLERRLGPWTLWGLGVGYVISGEYFGWNLGLPLAGTWGMLIAFALVTAMYVAFVLSYAELACAIPRAGGGFTYAVRGLGPLGGFVTGVAQLAEFVFAPPAIAMALGAYAAVRWPEAEPKWVAVVAMTAFTGLNLWGVRQAAVFELVVTLLATSELLLFIGLTAPAVRFERFAANGWPHGWIGVAAALPFAVWFYLAIEGVANAAEEAKRPQRDVAIGFGSALATLVLLAAGVLICAVGVGGWERVVWHPNDLVADRSAVLPREGATASDSPLPLALAQVLAPTHPLYQLLIGVGALGLICSLNGILLAAGRALFEMGRAGYLPEALGRVNRFTHTPSAALCANWAAGTAAILWLDTAGLITLSAMGAVVLYVLSMESLVRLRRSEPALERPFRAPLFPWLPRAAQFLAAAVLLAMLWQNGSRDRPWASLSAAFLYGASAAVVYYALVLRPRLARRRTGEP